MLGINFIEQNPIADTLPNRVDVACFVGFVATRKATQVLDDEPGIKTWLEHRGYFQNKQKQNQAEADDPMFPGAARLRDVPVPIENWNSFDRLFAWDQRPIKNSPERCTTYLGAAVKSFFAQGGRKCYIICIDEPILLGAGQPGRDVQLAKLLLNHKAITRGMAADREQWSSFLHLFGLDDVSFLSLPDLPELCQNYVPEPQAKPQQIKSSQEEFVECSTSFDVEPPTPRLDNFLAPYCDSEGIGAWSKNIQYLAGFIASFRREVQLVASLPIIHPSLAESGSITAVLKENGLLTGDLDPLQVGTPQHKTIASAFVQLGYPWLQTENAWRLPQQLECPEGVLVGMMANNALTRGTFRAASALDPVELINTYPELEHHEVFEPPLSENLVAGSGAMLERISVFHPSINGIRLLTDVSTADNTGFRQGSVSRLTALIIRAARRLGEEYIFETNGPELWFRIKLHLIDMLSLLFDSGAFRGENIGQAFEVRCDRSTMTQNDIDYGRIIAQIQFIPTVSIETINIHLNLVDGRVSSTASIGIQGAAL